MAEAYTPILLARLRSLHAALDEAGFEHCVGGAIALAVHVQEPRFTADIDLNVMADPEQPGPLLACLPEAITIHAKAAEELGRDGQTRLIWPDPETPIDLFLPQHPSYHQFVNDRAIPVDFLGTGIKVMDPTDLMVFKVLFGRSKDWVDIESLFENRVGDVEEAARWLGEFLGSDDARIGRLLELHRMTGANR